MNFRCKIKFIWSFILLMMPIDVLGHLLRAEPLSQHPSEEFRRIFYTLARETYSEADIAQLIYPPVAAFEEPGPLKSDPLLALKTREETWAQFKPKDAFLAAQGSPEPYSRLELDKSLSENPVTLIVIPGIFGEFIKDTPFDEILKNTSSSYTREFMALMDKSSSQDSVFDLEILAEREKELKDLVLAASIDDKEGKSLVRIIYLKPELGSLETLGTLDDSSQVYLRRMDKLKNALGSFQNLYLVGYSRGLNVGLDLVAKAEKAPDQHSWVKELKGVVSLGGTLYGSPLADAALQDGNPMGEALTRLKVLSEELEVLAPDANLFKKIEVVSKNSAAWAKASADLLVIGSRMKTPEEFAWESIPTDLPNFGAFGELVKSLLLEKFKISVGSEYNSNVEKFKFLLKKVSDGIDSISLKSAVDWQRREVIPERISYFVIQGAMADASKKEGELSPILSNTLAFNHKTLDYRSLRKSYYDYYHLRGVEWNDSQVSPDRSIFWPELHSALNAKQKPFQAYLLALVGTDHWGMSFPVALESQSQELSPYPRRLLAHSLGAFLARHSLSSTERDLP